MENHIFYTSRNNHPTGQALIVACQMFFYALNINERLLKNIHSTSMSIPQNKLSTGVDLTREEDTSKLSINLCTFP